MCSFHEYYEVNVNGPSACFIFKITEKPSIKFWNGQKMNSEFVVFIGIKYGYQLRKKWFVPRDYI